MRQEIAASKATQAYTEAVTPGAEAESKTKQNLLRAQTIIGAMDPKLQNMQEPVLDQTGAPVLGPDGQPTTQNKLDQNGVPQPNVPAIQEMLHLHGLSHYTAPLAAETIKLSADKIANSVNEQNLAKNRFEATTTSQAVIGSGLSGIKDDTELLKHYNLAVNAAKDKLGPYVVNDNSFPPFKTAGEVRGFITQVQLQGQTMQQRQELAQQASATAVAKEGVDVNVRAGRMTGTEAEKQAGVDDQYASQALAGSRSVVALRSALSKISGAGAWTQTQIDKYITLHPEFAPASAAIAKSNLEHPGQDFTVNTPGVEKTLVIDSGMYSKRAAGGHKVYNEGMRGTTPAPAQPGTTKPVAEGAIPKTNAKGWKLHTDSKGNKAYVGPNNQVEEVK
jgi:hypothetical protein